MRKLGTISAVFVLALLIYGCGGNSAESEVQAKRQDIAEQENKEVSQSVEFPASSLEVLKDGKIIETIKEDFSKDYYKEDELKNMILSEAAGFNKEKDADISIDKFENKDGMITVVMKYPSADIYTEYNSDEYEKRELFVGTVSEAYDSGKISDVKLKNVKNEEETIGKEELLQMGKRNILITNERVEVKTFGKILYVGENIESSGKNEVMTGLQQADENEEYYYIVFK